MRARTATLAVLLLAAPGTASAMTVAEFVAKADALRTRGMGALFSSDYKLLKGEIHTAVKQLRAEQTAAVTARRPPATCLPTPVRFKNDELLASLRAIPAPQQRISIKDGFARFARAKFPC